MKVYVGKTDWSWYEYLRDKNLDEVNFWKPSGVPFKALQEGDLFLFKMKAPQGGRIAGGGFFTRYVTMTVERAWRAFGNENGVDNLAELSERIGGYRSGAGAREENPRIGCIILNDVFWFDERDWFDVPGNQDDWRYIVSGKSYGAEEPDGKWLYEQTEMRLKAKMLEDGPTATLPAAVTDGAGEADRYGFHMARHRLGQGAFRALVADAYHDRCAITGERTLPVLQAAHIRPYAKQGPHAVCNGLFLRSDMHTLFDAGYLTVTPDLTIHVSKRLHSDFDNGRIYYAYQGEKLAIVPDALGDQPSRDFLEWHNDTVFLG